MKDHIRFATPDVGEKEVKLVGSAIESRWLTTGPEVWALEGELAKKSGVKRAVCCDSCSFAMEVALRALGIGPGDEVITTPFTYTSTAEAIYHVGAQIVFADLDGESFEMDYQKVAEAITPRTKAVMPVDYGGKLCDYGALMKALEEHRSLFHPANDLQAAIGRVAIVADAAHSFGATQGSRSSGQFADFTCFSFHVLKNITTGGEGGAVVWNDFPAYDNDELEKTIRLLLDHGQTSRDKSGGWEYDIKLLGFNSIMTNLDAAMGLAQLDRLDEIMDKRVEVTHRYDMLFDSGVSKAAVPMIRHFGPDYMSAMHLYPVHFDGGHERRNEIYRKLMEMGVPCNVHYKPLPMMTAYKQLGFEASRYPNANRQFFGLLTIPYHTDLTADEQEYIVECIGKAATA